MKLECVPKFCYLGDTLGAGGGADKAAIELWCDVLVQGAIAHPYSLSLQPVGRGASYFMNGKMFRACVQSVLTYGIETWALKAKNLQSLGRAERMIMSWICGVSLKDRKRSEVFSVRSFGCSERG